VVGELKTKCSRSKNRHAERVSASISQPRPQGREAKWTLEPEACLHKQVQGDDHFVGMARILSGQTAILLGWRPDDFWNATPAELAAILAAFLPAGDDAADGEILTQLMELFPDAPIGGE
jgi:hypothetical protein